MESSGRRGSAGWRVIAAVVGLMAVLIAYFWVHKPLDPALLGSLGGAFMDVFAAAVIVVVAGGLGRRILSWLDMSALSRAERVALEGALGLGVLAWVALALGLVGLYRGVIFWIALIVIVAVCLRAVIGWLRDMLALIRRAFSFDPGWSRFLAIITLFLLFTALLHALTPPTAFDSINYHLVGPSRYLSAGRIAAQPDNHFLGFPQGMEILYGVAMGLFELLTVSQAITQQGDFRGQGLIGETLAFAALLFWTVSYTMSRESQRLERRLGVGER